MSPIAFPLPVPGDVVYCLFPEGLGTPGHKPRTALVTGIRKLPSGVLAVQVAYGTSQRVNELHAGEFAIVPQDGEPFITSGLSFPTKFDLRTQVTLPYTDTWFRVVPKPTFGQTPKMGTLHASLMKRAIAAFNALNPPKNK